MPSIRSTENPATYAPVRSIERHTKDCMLPARDSELYRERPVLAASRAATLENDEENATLKDSPAEYCSRRSVGRALLAYLMPLALLPMPLILREDVSLQEFSMVVHISM